MKKTDSCCIIDDDEFFAFNTKKLMKDIGFCENILCYADGQEAIDSLVALLIENISLPKIIFLDLNMPNKDGWGFLEDFQKIPKHQREDIKVYIVSSFVSPENMAKAQNYASVTNYLVKPITEESLMDLK